MKKVVLYLSMQPHDGGKFQYSINIADALSKLAINRLCELNIVANDKVWEEYLNSRSIIHAPDYSYIEKKLKRIFTKKLRLLNLWRFIGRYIDPVQKLFFSLCPDIIFYPGNDSLAYECAIPSVIPIFDLMHRYESRFSEVGEKSIYEEREYHYRSVCKYASAVLVDSELGKKQAIESYSMDEKKIVVLPYAPPRYVYDYVNEGILDKYTLPEKFIFYPAQFWSHKNHIVIIKALALLKERHHLLVNAVFVGSRKNAYDQVQNIISEHNLNEQIKILGYINNDELVALYKKAQALVFPSFFGPTNIPPLEARALNCPVIISDIYAHREQLGEYASYFNPESHVELAEILHAFLTKKKIASSNDQRTSGRDHESIILTYASILEKIIYAVN